jgi:hypothetical protein
MVAGVCDSSRAGAPRWSPFCSKGCKIVMAPHARPDESARVDGWAPASAPACFGPQRREGGSFWCLDDGQLCGGVALDIEFVAMVLRARCEVSFSWPRQCRAQCWAARCELNARRR